MRAFVEEMTDSGELVIAVRCTRSEAIGLARSQAEREILRLCLETQSTADRILVAIVALRGVEREVREREERRVIK